MDFVRARLTATFITLQDSLRNVGIVNNMCYAKTGNQLSTDALVELSGGSMTTPEHVSTGHHTASRVEVSTSFIVCPF